ncbi:ABC transporter permease, partial [Pseudoalteromonas sp. S185]
MTALLTAILANPTVIAILAGIVGAIGWGLRQRRAG